MDFPEHFLWGAATASYQIEGGGLQEGRGECIWHRFSHTPGKVLNGDTGDVACDHLHRYREDVALMAELGLDAYRFSISWPRVLPAGTGATNAAGLDFYDRLVDALLEVNIRPFVTLYHWDLPQALQDQGGWENPASVQWFADYTGLMAQRLGDRVKDWITINEPWVIAFLGNFTGEHAPGKQDLRAAYQVAHHLLLAHAAAIPVIRAAVPDARAGITLNVNYIDAATDSEADQQAARRQDGYVARWFLDPLYRGQYPQDMVDWLGDTLSGIDLAAVSAATVPTDFLGINYYTRNTVAHADEGPFQTKMITHAGSLYTEMGWEVYPDGLRRLLIRLHEDYAPGAIYITENGAAFEDPPPANGVIEDPLRVAYLEAHFEAASQAIAAGVPLKGYFVWSLLDNFEWAYGYSKRFGIIYVDYETQRRVLKRSALYLQRVIRGEV
ncbi:MAG TPA: GH1 family beta-glucosidase [Spirillospora sp.]|nr:GH1 family beta-glucosidase [Spirillospora sp.]